MNQEGRTALVWEIFTLPCERSFLFVRSLGKWVYMTLRFDRPLSCWLRGFVLFSFQQALFPQHIILA